MSGEDPEYIETLTTDSTGTASTTLAAGEYELVANASGFDPDTLRIAHDNDGTALLSLEASPASPDDFSFETYLENGQYTVVTDHPDYWADVTTIGVNSAPQRYDPSLTAYGDAVDTTGLTQVNTLVTDSDGFGRFEMLVDDNYVLEFNHTDYQTKTERVTHQNATDLTTALEATNVLSPPREGEGGGGRTPPTAGDAEGFDPGIALPDGDPHFEVAAIDTEAGLDFSIPILVVNAGGSKGATDLRLELDTTGEVLYTRDVTLQPGNYTIAQIPVRTLAQRVSLPRDVTVSTLHDEERFTLTSTADAREITGPGIPTTLGEPSTLGEEAPSTLGPDREPHAAADYGFPDEGWALTLEAPNGERRVLTTIIDEPDIEDVHSKASSWSVVVPADQSLNTWDFDVRAYLTRDGEIVNIGWCDTVESSTDDQATQLSGPGPFGELRGDEMEVEILHNTDWRAAEKIVQKVAPEWDITVLRTDDPLIVREETYSGSALSILKSFCDDYGLFFRPSSTHYRQGMIFAPGGVASLVDLDPISIEVNTTSESYANEVVFRGDGVKVTESNEAEIRRLAENRDLRISDARETVSVEDEKVETKFKARERAKAELRERIDNYESGGNIEMPARRIRPGLAYPMPSDSEVWHSARAVRLDGNGAVELPPRMTSRLDYSGAVAIAFRAGDWSDLTDLEMRLFGVWGTSSTIQTASQELTFQATTDAGRGAFAYPFDSPPDDGEWHLVHYEWEYNPGDGTTGGEDYPDATPESSYGFGEGEFGIQPFGGTIQGTGYGSVDYSTAGYGSGNEENTGGVEGTGGFGTGGMGVGGYGNGRFLDDSGSPSEGTYGSGEFGRGYYGHVDTGSGTENRGWGYGDFGGGDYGIGGYIEEDDTMTPSPGDTVVRAGVDGEIIDQSVVSGAIRTYGTRSAAIGRAGPNYLDETIIEGAWFFSEPQPEQRYERLYKGMNTPAEDLVAHYPLDETPDETTAFDTVGGWHATKDDTRPAGRPVTLDSASHSLTTTTGDFNREVTYDEFLRAVANR